MDTLIERLDFLTPDRGIMVIDMDTGTVLGTNLRVCLVPETEDQMEEISSSDSAAWDYADSNGHPLFLVTEK